MVHLMDIPLGHLDNHLDIPLVCTWTFHLDIHLDIHLEIPLVCTDAKDFKRLSFLGRVAHLPSSLKHPASGSSSMSQRGSGSGRGDRGSMQRWGTSRHSKHSSAQDVSSADEVSACLCGLRAVCHSLKLGILIRRGEVSW